MTQSGNGLRATAAAAAVMPIKKKQQVFELYQDESSAGC